MRVKYIVKCFRSLILERNYYTNNLSKSNVNKLLIVKTDAIGDYILFRNFLSFFKNSKMFSNCKITLVVNELVKDLVLEFDKSLIDDLIFINRKEFLNNNNYRKEFLKKIQKKEFDYAINPSFSREFLIADSIIRASISKKKIGQYGNLSNDYFFIKKLSDYWYSKIIDTGQNTQFEFLRTKSFLELLSKENVEVFQPNLPIKEDIKQNYLVFFPGAGEKIKQWLPENFSKIANEILNKTNLEIRICGSKIDSTIAAEIIEKIEKKDRVLNLCGNTNLIELSSQINNARALITNDSSAYHIAANLNTKTICFLIGRHYGRFAPYPFENLQKQLFYCLPPSFDPNPIYQEKILDINEIKVDVVLDIIFSKEFDL